MSENSIVVAIPFNDETLPKLENLVSTKTLSSLKWSKELYSGKLPGPFYVILTVDRTGKLVEALFTDRPGLREEHKFVGNEKRNDFSRLCLTAKHPRMKQRKKR